MKGFLVSRTTATAKPVVLKKLRTNVVGKKRKETILNGSRLASSPLLRSHMKDKRAAILCLKLKTA